MKTGILPTKVASLCGDTRPCTIASSMGILRAGVLCGSSRATGCSLPLAGDCGSLDGVGLEKRTRFIARIGGSGVGVLGSWGSDKGCCSGGWGLVSSTMEARPELLFWVISSAGPDTVFGGEESRRVSKLVEVGDKDPNS